MLREFNDLIDKALKSGIKSPDSYYVEGKIKGKTSRDKGIEAQKVPEISNSVKKVPITDIGTSFDDLSEEEEYSTPVKRPSMNELPKFINKGRAVEIPSFLKNFKLFKKNL